MIWAVGLIALIGAPNICVYQDVYILSRPAASRLTECLYGFMQETQVHRLLRGTIEWLILLNELSPLKSLHLQLHLPLGGIKSTRDRGRPACRKSPALN